MDTVMNSTVAAIQIKKRIPRESYFKTWIEKNTIKVGIMSSILSIKSISPKVANSLPLESPSLNLPPTQGFPRQLLIRLQQQPLHQLIMTSGYLYMCYSQPRLEHSSLWCSKLVKLVWTQGRYPILHFKSVIWVKLNVFIGFLNQHFKNTDIWSKRCT